MSVSAFSTFLRRVINLSTSLISFHHQAAVVRWNLEPLWKCKKYEESWYLWVSFVVRPHPPTYFSLARDVTVNWHRNSLPFIFLHQFTQILRILPCFLGHAASIFSASAACFTAGARSLCFSSRRFKSLTTHIFTEMLFYKFFFPLVSQLCFFRVFVLSLFIATFFLVCFIVTLLLLR